MRAIHLITFLLPLAYGGTVKPYKDKQCKTPLAATYDGNPNATSPDFFRIVDAPGLVYFNRTSALTQANPSNGSFPWFYVDHEIPDGCLVVAMQASGHGHTSVQSYKLAEGNIQFIAKEKGCYPFPPSRDLPNDIAVATCCGSQCAPYTLGNDKILAIERPPPPPAAVLNVRPAGAKFAFDSCATAQPSDPWFEYADQQSCDSDTKCLAEPCWVNIPAIQFGPFDRSLTISANETLTDKNGVSLDLQAGRELLGLLPWPLGSKRLLMSSVRPKETNFGMSLGMNMLTWTNRYTCYSVKVNCEGGSGLSAAKLTYCDPDSSSDHPLYTAVNLGKPN